MTGVLLPVSGVGNFIPGSTLSGGQMTPSDRARRLLRLSGGVARPCGSPCTTGGVPGDPGVTDGEQGADPDMAELGACPAAGTASIERAIAARSAVASSQIFRMGCIALMQIQRAARAHGSVTGLRREPFRLPWR
jgi:hypothetical protein